MLRVCRKLLASVVLAVLLASCAKSGDPSHEQEREQPPVENGEGDAAAATGSVSDEPTVSDARKLFLQALLDIEDGAVSKGYESLRAAAAAEEGDAMLTLGVSLLYGNSSETPLNTTAAAALFEKCAATGHASCQWALGLAYATGAGVNASQAKALLYYTFAALGGDQNARMALGYRYHKGHTVADNCETAISYYRLAADKVEAEVQVHGSTVTERLRLSPTGKRAKTHSDRDVMQYYQYNADRGDRASQLVLGQMFHQGQGVAQDFAEAQRYFRMAAAHGDATAMTFLGDMYAHGLGVEQNNKTAFEWIEKAASKSNAAGRNSLGTLYLHGQGVPKDAGKAFKLFLKAAAQGLADAQLNLGTLYYNGIGTERDYRKAIHYFSLAAQGHVLAMYNLGLMHATGTGTARSCPMATSLFKNVAERGAVGKQLMAAHELYEAGDPDAALMRYLVLAELGFEVAQHNAAFLIHSGATEVFAEEGGLSVGEYQRAYINWKRSADQGHSGSRVKVGDYLYYGHGVEGSIEAAATEYRRAADAHNAEAMFNLGVMHHFGDGLDEDLHLAKRFYDMALGASADAYALFLLQDVREAHMPRIRRFVQRVLDSDMDISAMVEGYEPTIVIVLSIVLAAVCLARQLHVHHFRLQRQAEHARQVERLRQLLEQQEREQQQESVLNEDNENAAEERNDDEDE